jgi:hypothetical protein
MRLSVKLTGFDELHRTLKEVEAALHELNGHVASLHFDAADEDSINAAIQTIDNEIDRRLAPFRTNRMVTAIAAEFKSKVAGNVRQRAMEARSKQ